MLLAPLSGVAALVGRGAAVVTRSSESLGSAATIGHEAASGVATTMTSTTTATGTGAAGAAGTSAATASAPTAGAAGAGPVTAGPPPAQGTAAQTAGIGAAAAAAVATVVAVMALTGDPEPEAAAPETSAPPPAVETSPPPLDPPPPDPPVPGPGVFTTDATATLAGDLFSEAATTGTGDGLEIIALDGSAADLGRPVILASGATITVAADGSFTYEPGEAFESLGAAETATDAITYTVTDGAGWSADWTATITVTGVNDEPLLADPPPVVLREGTTDQIVIAATDPDGDTLTIALSPDAPAFVELVDRGDGTATVTIAPGAADTGSHQLGVTAIDGGSPPLSATVTLTITVTEAPARVSEGLLALYEFETTAGATVVDTSGIGEPLDLTVADPTAVSRSAGGIDIRAATTIRSAGPASKIFEAVARSNELTVEAWVTSSDTTQSGPARVVSLSDGNLERNVTLGQGGPIGTDGDHWTARLRTTETSANGLPAISTPDGTARPATAHLVYTRSSTGEARLYVDGDIAATGTVGGDLSNWEPSYPLFLANEASGDRAWTGTIHLVAIYGRALTSEEVATNLRIGPAGD